MKKAACYVRVSTENQLENYSIDEQTEKLKNFCKAKDYTVYRIYTDGGYSGGNTDRPALKAMLKDIESNKIDTVIVYKLDRLSRSQKDTLSLIEDSFLAHNVDFISVSENFDTSSPFGKAMIGMLSVFAQLEKDQITERFTMGRIGRSRSGLFHGGGNAPRGYDYIDGQLKINTAEACQIRDLYELFLSGKSVNAAANIVSHKYNIEMSATKALNALRNNIYIGKVKFKGVTYDGQHEPIISKNDFELVQAILQSSKREASKSTSQKNPFRAGYFLSGLVFCKRCGAKYSAAHGCYRCYSRSKCSPKFVMDRDCKNKHWPIQELDTLVLKEIYAASLDKNYQSLIKQSEETKSFNRKTLKKEISKIDAQINKLIDLYQISDIPILSVKEKIQDLTAQKEALNTMISAPKKDKLQEFENNLKNFLDIAERSDTSIEEKRFSLSTLVERITVDGDKIELFWRI